MIRVSIRNRSHSQREYCVGPRAWLEYLSRFADALVSADQDAEDDNAEESNNESGGSA